LFGPDSDPKPRLRDRYPGQVYILHDRSDDGHATGFRGEGINLISSLANVAKEAFNGIGCTNISMHDFGKGIKRQQMLLIFAEAADGLWVALLVFGLKGCQIEQRVLFLLLLEDPSSFRADLFALPMGNGIEHIALFMHDTALPRSGRKEGRDGSEESLMPISYNEIQLSGPTSTNILQKTTRLCLPPRTPVRPIHPCFLPDPRQVRLR
jgi:hypothetical protein